MPASACISFPKTEKEANCWMFVFVTTGVIVILGLG